MSRTPTICVGVPVWRGAAFVAETLDSIRHQRDVRFVVAISIDGADEESERACHPILADPRFRIIVQADRLGWVRNSAAVLAAALVEGTDYACIQPHDDLMDEDYLASLLDEAEKHPLAAAVYSDLAPFGGKSSAILTQETVAGNPVERALALLSKHFNAVAYRGLTRTPLLRLLPAMSGNTCDDFAADTVWMARLATAGDLIRVPRALYRKRYHPENTHSGWNTWPLEKKITAWKQHCLDMHAEALRVSSGESAHRLLFAAAERRLLQTERRLGPFHREIAALGQADRRKLLDEFTRAAAGLSVRPKARPA
jgi:glycosyltransferase involved in cell wall biosynthesis